MAWYLYPAIVAAGFTAGFVNTLAGSGSLITLPLLIFAGLPPTVANGTNRVAILLQNVVAVKTFHGRGLLDARRGLLLSVPAIAGAVAGALIAVDINEATMRKAIGVVMCAMLVVIIVRPRRWLEGRAGGAGRGIRLAEIIVMFAIGVYGGFIQAGVGILLLAGLVLGAGYDLIRANAVKVLIVLCYTPFALGLFVARGRVEWPAGLVLAAGNMLGAWAAAGTAARRGAGFVRWILIAVVIVSALVLLGAPDFEMKI